MSTVFTGIFMRHVYVKTLPAALAAASSAATAVQIATLSMGARFMYFDNTLNQELSILMVAPEADSTVAANRKLFIELDTNRVINYDFLPGLGMNVPPGTQIWLFSAVAPVSGSFKLSAWA